MPNAVITDTFLDKPFDRKTNFMAAFKTAVHNAGFSTTDLDTYDIRDEQSYTSNSSAAHFNAGSIGSLVAFVKTVVLNGSATQGTIQMPFFSRTGYLSSFGGVQSSTATNETMFCPGNFACVGGWDTTNKKPTSSVDGNAIGGYVADYSACLTQLTATANAAYTYSGGSAGASTRLPSGHPFQGAVLATDLTTNPFNFTNPIYFKAVSHPEVRGVFVYQSSRPVIFCGYIRPATLPSWWNENTYPYCFLTPNGDFLNFRGFSGALSPYSGTTQQTSYRIGNLSLGSGNSANASKRDVLSAPVLLDNQTQVGVVGRFSSDIVLIQYTNLAQFDKAIVTAGVEEYLILSGGRYGRPPTVNTATYPNVIDNTTYGLGIRVV